MTLRPLVLFFFFYSLTAISVEYDFMRHGDDTVMMMTFLFRFTFLSLVSLAHKVWTRYSFRNGQLQIGAAQHFRNALCVYYEQKTNKKNTGRNGLLGSHHLVLQAALS